MAVAVNVLVTEPMPKSVCGVTGASEATLSTPNVACSSRSPARIPRAAPGTWYWRIAATSVSATARNAGEASAARVLGSGSASAVGVPATGVLAAGGVVADVATGVDCAVSRRSCGVSAETAAAVVRERTRRREIGDGGDADGTMDPPAWVRTACSHHTGTPQAAVGTPMRTSRGSPTGSYVFPWLWVLLREGGNIMRDVRDGARVMAVAKIVRPRWALTSCGGLVHAGPADASLAPRASARIGTVARSRCHARPARTGGGHPEGGRWAVAARGRPCRVLAPAAGNHRGLGAALSGGRGGRVARPSRSRQQAGVFPLTAEEASRTLR